MERFVQAEVEWFVRAIVTGGLALVAGLWLTTLFTRGQPAWLVGVGLVLAGIVGLAVGIWTEIEW